MAFLPEGIKIDPWFAGVGVLSLALAAFSALAGYDVSDGSLDMVGGPELQDGTAESFRFYAASLAAAVLAVVALRESVTKVKSSSEKKKPSWTRKGWPR